MLPSVSRSTLLLFNSSKTMLVKNTYINESNLVSEIIRWKIISSYYFSKLLKNNMNLNENKINVL